MANLWKQAARADGKSDTADQSAQSARQRAQARLEEVREQLRAGETTGDPLQDYALMTTGASDEALAKLRALDADLRAHEGDLILIVEHDEQHHGCTGFGGRARPENYHRDEWLTLAIIGLGGLMVMREQARWELKLPIGPYVSYETTRTRMKPELQVDSWKLHRFGWMGGFLDFLDEPIKYTNPMAARHSSGDKRIEVQVGLDAVQGWFEHDVNERYFLARRPFVTVFQRMAKLLGVEVADSELIAEQKESAETAHRQLELLYSEHLRQEPSMAIPPKLASQMRDLIKVIEEGGLGEDLLVVLISQKLTETVTVS